MFNSLTGRITTTGPGYVRVQTGGIEWHLDASTRTAQRLSGSGGEVRVPVYLYHRDDVMRMYGFADEQERRVFSELLTVPGIGPTQALKILSGVTARELQGLLEREDVKGLSSLPGLGRKTAEKMVFTLKGKIVTTPDGGAEPLSDIVQALADMGFEERRAAEVVRGVLSAGDLPDDASGRESEVLRRAIVELS